MQRVRSLALVLLVGCGSSKPHAPETGSWQPIPPSIGVLDGPPSVWTGSEFIVWGRTLDTCENSTSNCGQSVGARYNPAQNIWTGMTSAVPVDVIEGRTNTPAVWTGKEMIVWGGRCPDICAGSGAYNPATDTWRVLSVTGAPSWRDFYAVAWTGTRMLIWGGETETVQRQLQDLGDGAAYDPATDTWSPMSAQGAPSARGAYVVAWTGTRMLVWGGGNASTDYLADGAAYDPATDTWSPMHAGGPTGPGLSVWTGSELIIWQGQSGAAYNPATDSWRPLPTDLAPDQANGPGVWTGTELLIWGGDPDYGPGGRYNPKTNTWGAMTTAGQPGPRRAPIAAWTGTEMLLWGGALAADRVPIALADGARFTP
jgi:N-acetylneuraminic acid mutarotase